MIQTDETIPKARRKASPLVLIVGAILVVCALFLAFPSSRANRQAKALNMLATEYAGPKDVTYLYSGYMVTNRNEVESVGVLDRAQIVVFAPGPKDSVPYDLLNGMNDYRTPGNKKGPKYVCLLAPDPKNSDWSLFAAVWIGQALEAKLKIYKHTMQMTNLGFNMIIPPSASKTPMTVSSSVMTTTLSASTLKDLRKTFSEFDPQVQAMALDTLDSNRKVIGSLTGLHRFYQDGQGHNYEIKSPDNIWQFENMLRDAYPNLRSDQ